MKDEDAAKNIFEALSEIGNFTQEVISKKAEDSKSLDMKFDRICSSCKKNINSDSYAGKINQDPRPNDISICFYCAEINLYNDDLTLRLPTEEDILNLTENYEDWKRINEIRMKIFEKNRLLDKRNLVLKQKAIRGW